MKDIKFFKIFYPEAKTISYLYLIPEKYVKGSIFNPYIVWNPVGTEKKYTNYILLDFFFTKESNKIKKKLSYYSIKKIFNKTCPSRNYCVYLHRVPKKRGDILKLVKRDVVNIKGISDKVVDWVKENI